MTLRTTLGNDAWMVANVAKIKAVLPQTWTHMQNLNLLAIGFQLKLLGIDWRSQEELSKCIVFFERTGLLQRDGMTVRAKP